ncbi:MAG: HAD hydrolase-like protein, partial [Candidatus Bathyarchaeota archaeon]|nr:HAD hydrolase-like protein [Candidatus Bathyarchaeota archaeon]
MKLHTNNKQTQMQLNKLKAEGIFLDLDGTIVDSTEAYIEAARIAFQAIGKKAPAEATLLEIPRRIEQYKTIDDITEGYTREFLPIYLNAYHSIAEQTTRLLPNMLSTLETLSKKSKLALITMR